MNHSQRLRRHHSASSHLALMDDHQLAALLTEATPVGVGIGGTTFMVDVDGVPVFVKQVPLTDLERLPRHTHSTANLFDLPTFYQYGIGSAGFGVWRELAVHAMTTDWVLSGDYPGFPLLYHWRILPRQPSLSASTDVEQMVSYWDDSPQIRTRLTAIEQASAQVVLFIEYFPYTVHTWLTEQTTAGGQTAVSAYALVKRELAAGTQFMNSRGLLHFDAHFYNLLTDGHRLYFADFGLAMHAGFDFSPAETAFFAQHAAYDQYYTQAHLARWLVASLLGIDLRSTECDAYLRAHAEGNTGNLPETAMSIISRYASIAVVMGDFFGRLRTVSKATPYPVEDIQRAFRK